MCLAVVTLFIPHSLGFIYIFMNIFDLLALNVNEVTGVLISFNILNPLYV